MALTDRTDDPRQGKDEGAFWRRLTLPVEDRLDRLPPLAQRRGYRWFRSENVVCIEHFRGGRTPGQKAAHFGWVDASRSG
jgi:hypothetical protein